MTTGADAGRCASRSRFLVPIVLVTLFVVVGVVGGGTTSRRPPPTAVSVAAPLTTPAAPVVPTAAPAGEDVGTVTDLVSRWQAGDC